MCVSSVWVVTPALIEHVAAVPVAGEVDPTGAGDTYSVTYIVQRVAGAEPDAAEEVPQGFLKRLFKPREKSFERVGGWFEALYRRGGWVLFTRPALYAIVALIVGGLGAFVYLIVGRYGTPFVVAQRVGLGALIFLLGRFAVVAVHETAHGAVLRINGVTMAVRTLNEDRVEVGERKITVDYLTEPGSRHLVGLVATGAALGHPGFPWTFGGCGVLIVLALPLAIRAVRTDRRTGRTDRRTGRADRRTDRADRDRP